MCARRGGCARTVAIPDDAKGTREEAYRVDGTHPRVLRSVHRAADSVAVAGAGDGNNF